jgi:hypothetical protein
MTQIAQLIPDPDDFLRKEGWRLVVMVDEPDEPGTTHQVMVEHQRVLPEEVSNPEANAILETKGLGILCMEEVRWLHARLGEVIAASGAASDDQKKCCDLHPDFMHEMVSP